MNRKDIVVATVLSPSGQSAGSTLNLNYDRTIVMASAAIGPLRTVEYHHTQGLLWGLEEATPSRLLAIDVTSGSASLIADSTTVPELAQMHSGMSVFVPSAGRVTGSAACDGLCESAG